MFDIPKERIGVIASQLVLWGFPFSIVATFSAGYIFDIVGRRLTLFISFLLGSFCIFWMPYMAPNVFP